MDARPQSTACQVDGAQSEQVLHALVVNAIEAIPQDGNLRSGCECNQENRLRIIVRDDGAGIPAEIPPRTFPPFLTTKQTGKGVGLELGSILERPSGIEVHSELGRGTTFMVALPSDKGRAAAVTPANR